MEGHFNLVLSSRIRNIEKAVKALVRPGGKRACPSCLYWPRLWVTGVEPADVIDGYWPGGRCANPECRATPGTVIIVTPDVLEAV